MKIRVYYEDTDAAGIVYYANYLKFCERARSELFFQAGLSPQSSEGYFVVQHIEATYYHPARLGELLGIQTRLIKKGRAFVWLQQSVYKDDMLLFDMAIRLAFLKGRKVARIPPHLYSILESLGEVSKIS